MKTKKILMGGVLLLLAALTYAVIISTGIGDNPEKLWLHRCNSIEKMEEFAAEYPNIEVDIVYRGHGLFDITHDADTTFNLSIETFFARIGKSGSRIWLDIKNMTPSNVGSMFHDLDSLRCRRGIARQQLIIEGSSPDALATFTHKGYYTSFYVPYDKPSRLTESAKQACLDNLRAIADSRKVRAISFPGWWYSTIKQQLGRNIDLLTWKHRTSEFELRALPEGQSMLRDPQLKVILIKAKGHYHR